MIKLMEVVQDNRIDVASLSAYIKLAKSRIDSVNTKIPSEKM